MSFPVLSINPRVIFTFVVDTCSEYTRSFSESNESVLPLSGVPFSLLPRFVGGECSESGCPSMLSLPARTTAVAAVAGLKDLIS